MDPLSLAANIIAVVAAAESTAKILAKLVSLRDVPEQVLQLTNEVADFAAILTIVQETAKGARGDDSRLDDMLFYLKELMARGETTLRTIQTLINTRLIENNRKKIRSKVNWKSWIREQARIRDLMNSLRETRKDISNVLTIITASTMPDVRIELMNIMHIQQHNRSVLRSLEYSISDHTRELSLGLSNIRPSINGIQTLLDVRQAAIAKPSRIKLPNGTQALEAVRSSMNMSKFCVQTRAYQKPTCPAACLCKCHKVTTVTSHLRLKSFIGLLFVGYSGLPLVTEACTEKLCQSSKRTFLKVKYYFPAWFFARMLALTHDWSPVQGYQMTVKTPRVVSNDSAIFTTIQFGNISAVQALLRDRVASPFDIDAVRGETTLHLAINTENIEICKLLVNEGADIHHENNNNSSVMDLVWTKLLTKPFKKFNQDLRSLFQSYMDPDEDLIQRRFSAVHQIVLGLSNLDLETYLQISTAEIDSKCSQGRTPLGWAIISDNLVAVRMLLAFGAELNIADSYGYTPFLAASEMKEIDILRALISASMVRSASTTKKLIDQGSKDHLTPINVAVFHNLLPNVQLLLASSVDIDAGYSAEFSPKISRNSIPPLLSAIQLNSTRILMLLMDAGAKSFLKDEYDRGVLHYSAACGNEETMGILMERDLRRIGIEDRDVEGKTALDLFDELRPQFFPEDKEAFERSRTTFLRLLENVKAASQEPSSSNGLRDSSETPPDIDPIIDSEDGEDVFLDCGTSETAEENWEV